MMSEAFLQELEQESQATRRLLERLPEDKLDWRPHEKSMTLGQLAHHVATTPGILAALAGESEVPMPDFSQPAVTGVAEAIRCLDESLGTARTSLGRLDDAALAQTWRLVDGDREVMAMPRVALIRSILLNHTYHHRGQLTVYLRMLDVPLPSVYGPSADENPFAA